jgi:cytochrome c oxidase subunit 2
MKFPMVVDEPEDYEKWKASQEAWLKLNPEYLKKVPAALKEAAMIKAGLPLDVKIGSTVQTVSVNN